MKYGREFYRDQLVKLVPEFHEADRMLRSKLIPKHELKWGVVYEGGVALEEKIKRSLIFLNGMAGEW